MKPDAQMPQRDPVFCILHPTMAMPLLSLTYFDGFGQTQYFKLSEFVCQI